MGQYILAHDIGTSSDKAVLVDYTGRIAAMTAGGLVMCSGYLIAERIMYGSWALALIGLPWNIGQFAVGIAVSLALQPLYRYIPGTADLR